MYGSRRALVLRCLPSTFRKARTSCGPPRRVPRGRSPSPPAAVACRCAPASLVTLEGWASFPGLGPETDLRSFFDIDHMAGEEIINGMNVAELREYIGQVGKDSSVAERNPKIVARWVGGSRARIERDGVVVHMGGDQDQSAMWMLWRPTHPFLAGSSRGSRSRPRATSTSEGSWVSKGPSPATIKSAIPSG